ncbi:MAG: TonB-dependent receptor [Burkholderiales bacterium]|nr:TonB-dependent receptor [Burkholderiales bacterium]
MARAVIAALCGTASMMVAQETLAQAQSLQRVEITGTNIRRADAETAAPVQTVTREEIINSGKSSVAEYLQTLTADNAGSVPMTFGNGFASGASGISLRGFGAHATLVLINGRRIAPYGLADDGQKQFVDLNMIPLEAVDRVEVLKDGGSAIYGSDALGGVVNVILRKNFNGTVVKVDGGTSRYSDGNELKAAITHGFVNEASGLSVLLNFEMMKKEAIWNRDRKGRGLIGESDLRRIGFDHTGGTGAVATGGTGVIIQTNLAGSSIVGNVRNPATLEYYSRHNLNTAQTGFTRNFPAIDCAAMSNNYPQGGDANGGGCLIDATQQYTQVQPEQQTMNFFARASKMLNANTEVYGEFTLYKGESTSSGTPSGVSGSVGSPIGPVSNAGVALGAAHPDNPYFGSAARLRYLAADVGPRVGNLDSTFTRALLGMKGTWGTWDYDTALLHSENEVSNSRTGFLVRNVAFAMLNPTAANVAAASATSPAYAALVAANGGVAPFWRIGENANLNSAALYSVLSPTIGNDGKTKITQADVKVTTELGKMAGGAIGFAAGLEARRESATLEPTTFTSTGQIIGLGYSAYSAARTVWAAYAEGLFPVTKQLEASIAARYDHYSDVGNSFTPKASLKWRPVDNLALRGTYSKGFRAPGAAEISAGGVSVSAFTAAADPLRCAAGVVAACSAGSVALLISGNPNLQPEKSDSFTVGAVWDITPKTGLAIDYWQTKRKGEIGTEPTDSAIAAGRVVRDPSTSTGPGDPGAIISVLEQFVNASRTTVKGIDLDLKHRWDLEGGRGKITAGVTWTHMLKSERVDPDGTVRDFVGTHGNCDVTNCIGTARDRISMATGWEMGPWRVGLSANYRGRLSGTNFRGDPAGCAVLFPSGADAPTGCRIGSFTTFDLGLRYKLRDKTEIYGSIQNLFDRIPPWDPVTYGAINYNPLDYSGAVGRYYKIGVRHQF